jgi:hypothetical protein
LDSSINHSESVRFCEQFEPKNSVKKIGILHISVQAKTNDFYKRRNVMKNTKTIPTHLGALLMTFVLAACGNSGSSGGQTQPERKDSAVANQQKEIASCETSQAPTALNGSWFKELSQESRDVKFTFTFNRGYLKIGGLFTHPIDGECSVSIEVPILIEDNSFTTLGGAAQRADYTNGDGYCNLSIKEGLSVPYDFRGGCLLLGSQGNQEELLPIPSKD